MAGSQSRTEEDRFFDMTELDSNGCWLWKGCISKSGYSQFRVSDNGHKGHTVYGHVYSYEHFYCPIPIGYKLHHTCGIKRCVNPLHLQAMTHREHMHIDPNSTARKMLAKTHCPQGHPYSEANTYRRPSRGHRECRTCMGLPQLSSV